MSSLLYVLARRAIRARKWVVVIWAIFLGLVGAAAGLFGTGLDDSVSIPGTESGNALAQLEATFPEVSGASAQVVVSAPDGTNVTTQKSAIDDATDALMEIPLVRAVTALDDPLMPAEVSEDKTTALITVQLDALQTDVSDSVKDSLSSVATDLKNELPDRWTTLIGGSLFATEFPTLSWTEGLGLVVSLVVLVITLGTLAAASMPLITAIIGVAASTGITFAGTALFTINSTTPLLGIMLGLAVGIDYCLFIVARHRDQMKTGMNWEESIARSVGTAGSAVVFAGITVMIALLGLSVAGIPFLTVMACAGSLSVGLAVLVALTLLPALLGFFGPKVLTKNERKAALEPPATPKEKKFFTRWFKAATKLPAVTLVVLIAFLGFLAFPATGLRLALPDAGVLPESNQARQSYDLVAEKFSAGYNGPLIITTPILKSDDPLKLMDDMANEIRTLPGVGAVPLATPNMNADTGIIQVIPTGAPDSEETSQLVHDIRELHDQFEKDFDVDISVTGMTAVGIDVSQRLSDALLPFALVVVGLSLVLLAIVFRSIAVPITAALGYLLSVLAAFGVVTMVFQHGVLAGVFGVTRLGPVINFMPIILMGVLFGLSMDYQVFLVSRMREDFVHTGRSRSSVRTGFMASAKVVAAAAIIMVSVFAAFVPQGDTNIKPIALGLAVGVAIDAFVVRMTLIPAAMTLLGKWAWWIPKWLDKILPTLDIEGEGIVRQRELRKWPDEGIWLAAENVPVGERTVTINVPEDKGLWVCGSKETVKDFLAMVTGRKPLNGECLKVAGYLLPERSGAVRRRAALALTSEDLKIAVRENPEIIAAWMDSPCDIPNGPHVVIGTSSNEEPDPSKFMVLNLTHEGVLV